MVKIEAIDNQKMLEGNVGNENSYAATAISRPGGSEVYRLSSSAPKFQISRKRLQGNFLSILLSNQNEILKRGMT